MALQTASRLGPYEISVPLGAGGMGEVEPLCGRERAGEILSAFGEGSALEEIVLLNAGTKLGPYEIEPFWRRRSRQGKSRAKRGICC